MFIFFIDGASFISLDGHWSYFLVYSENKVRLDDKINSSWHMRQLTSRRKTTMDKEGESRPTSLESLNS